MKALEAMKADLTAQLGREIENLRAEFEAKSSGDILLKHIQSLKGDTGDAFVPTEDDYSRIAEKVIVPIVDKIIVEKTEVIHEQPIIKNEIVRETQTIVEQPITKEITKIIEKPIKAKEVARELNTLEEALDTKVIKGLDKQIKNLQRAVKEKGGGGMGNVQHESTNVSSATTTVTTTYSVAGNGFAIWPYYNGQLIVRGTHYTISDRTLTLLFTPQDSTNIDIIYIRG